METHDAASRWVDALTHVIEGGHLARGEDLSALVDGALRPLGLTGELLVVDLAQEALTPVRTDPRPPVRVGGTMGGRAYQLGETLPGVDDDVIDLAVFDALGHDIRAGLTSALAITAVRNARRDGETDLEALAARADDAIGSQSGPRQFATAVLARLDTSTGVLQYLLAGHPAPLLVRDGRVVKELTTTPRLPLGLTVPGAVPPVVGREQLEPSDRLLLYSDGIVEARDRDGTFFGEDRLVELTEHAEADDLSAPETLRRLGAAVLAHQGGRLQDDATLLLVDWSADGHLRMFPTVAAG